MDLLKLLAKDHGRDLVRVILLSLSGALLSIAVIVYIKERLLSGNSQQLSLVLIQFAMLLGLLLLTSVLAQSFLHLTGHRFVMNRRSWLVKRVLNTEMERLERLGGAAVMATLNTDIRNLSLAFVSMPELLYSGVLCALAMCYMAWLSAPLFLVTLTVLGVTAAAGMLLGGKIRHYIQRLRESDDALYRDYQAIIDGRKELSLNRARARQFFEEEFSRNAEAYRQNITRADIHYGLASHLANCVILGLVGLNFYLAVGQGLASLEVASTYALLILFLRAPLMSAMAALPTLMTANISLQKIESLALDSGESVFEKGDNPFGDFRKLQLDGVVYSYRQAEEDSVPFHVGPLDLTLNRGELVFVIGGNGSGKSTLARLLTGLYKPGEGQLLVNDMPVTDASRSAYRRLFSGVFTDFYLFRRLISGNGDEVDEKLVDHWLQQLQLDRKLGHAQGWLSDTRFSQGQRKRLALLLALLEQRDCILLDEWAADQDPQFRRVFYRELLPLLRQEGKTIIAITHDDHYFDVADRVLKMDMGQLTELTAEGLDHARKIVSSVVAQN